MASKESLNFYTPEEDDAIRRISTEGMRIDGGSQMVVRDLSGEYYRDLNLTILPGSNTVIIGDNTRARQELMEDLAHGADSVGRRNIQVPNGTKIEFVTPSVTDVEEPDMTLKDYFFASRGIAGVEERLTELWQDATNPDSLKEAGELQYSFEEASGWDAEREIQQLIEGLRLASNVHDKIDLNTRLRDMSSGQISKAIIGKALFSRAGIIIMDDPSVHLDVHSKHWLIDYVKNSSQATIFATTDMDFATEIGDRVIEILDSKLVLNIGTDVENYYKERQRLLTSWTDEAERKKQEIEDLRIHIRDFLAPAAKKTDNMAQVLRANVSKLGRMEAEYDEMPGKILIESRIHKQKQRVFQEGERSSQDLFQIDDLDIMYENPAEEGETTIVNIPKLSIHKGDKLAVVGSNGSGKSTLLRVLAGHREGMIIEGSLRTGPSTNLGYYSPYTEIARQDTPLRLMLAETSPDPMGILAYWGFDKSEHYDTTPSQLHYRDEIARAQFALLMARRPNVLILDEPTSYLTPSYQEKLLEAVRAYNGTLLVVSHDPNFLANLDLTGKINMPSAERFENYF